MKGLELGVGSRSNQLDALPTLRSRSLCASWAPPPIGGLCGKCHWLSPHRTTLPVRAVQVTEAPFFTGQISSKLVCHLLKTRGPGQQWVELRVIPSRLVPLPKVVANITVFILSRVCASCGSTPLRLSSSREQKSVFVKTVARVIAADTSISPSRNSGLLIMALAEKELAGEKSKVVASNSIVCWRA